MRQREDPSTDWMFRPLKGPLPGRSLHRLDVFGLWDAYKREDPPPVTGGIRTLENLVDSTDAEYEEDRPEKQFLHKLQWMWE